MQAHNNTPIMRDLHWLPVAKTKKMNGDSAFSVQPLDFRAIFHCQYDQKTIYVVLKKYLTTVIFTRHYAHA